MLAAISAFVLILHMTHANVIVDEGFPPFFKSCCYGDAKFRHGEVVLTLQRACLQLVCDDGRVVRRYLGEKGETDCCEFDGQLYSEAAILTAQCVTLQCRDSCWHPSQTIEECCSHCEAYNDPHFTTFDGHHYDYHGACNYSLAQRGSGFYTEVGVFADFDRCYGSASCLAHTVFMNDANTVVTLSSGAIFNVMVNGHPYFVDDDRVHGLRSAQGCHPVLAWRSPYGSPSPSCLTLLGSSRLMVQHCPDRLDVFAHPAHTDELDGLCGHFNELVDDDFTSRSGQVYPLDSSPLGFPYSWKTLDQSDAMCQAPCRDCQGDHLPSPCTATEAEKSRYRTICTNTIGETLGDLLHQLFYYIDDCVFDLCMIFDYGRDEREVDYWLGRLKAVVETAVYIYRNTEGNKMSTAQTFTPNSFPFTIAPSPTQPPVYTPI